MKLADIKTTDEVTAAINQRRADLDALQAETNDAKWSASEADRNRLERELRELSQLHKRISDREERARIQALEDTVSSNRAVVEAPNPIFDELCEHVATTALRAAELLAKLAEDEHARFVAHQAMSRAEERLGRMPRDLPPPPFTLHPPFVIIRERVGGALLDAGLLAVRGSIPAVYEPVIPTRHDTRATNASNDARWTNIPRDERELELAAERAEAAQ